MALIRQLTLDWKQQHRLELESLFRHTYFDSLLARAPFRDNKKFDVMHCASPIIFSGLCVLMILLFFRFSFFFF